MNALGQQMALRARRRRRRPAPGAGAGLRDRGLRRRRARGAPGRARWAGWAACRATATARRSPTTSAAPRPASTIASIRASWSASAPATPHGTQWVNSFMGQGWTDTRERRGLRLLHASRLLRRRAGGLRLFKQPAAAPDPDPRPAAAHRQRQHRRQPVPRPDRGRLQASASTRRPPATITPFAPLAGLERDAERLLANGAPARSASTWRSRRPTRCARPSAPTSPAPSALGNERKLDLGAAAGLAARVSPTPAGRSRRPSPARRPTPSPSTAPRRSATPP